MIELFIFHLHIIAALYIFTKNWQKQSAKEGLLGIAIFALFFAIGWAITGTIAHLIFPNSLDSIYFNSDSLSLIFLAIPETFFFYHFFIVEPKETLN